MNSTINFFGHIPNRLTMCTVENCFMYGVFKENPFHFKHNNLETLTVSADSDTLIHLDFDFDNGNYVEAYDTLMRSTGQYKGGRSMLVDYHDFGNGMMILVFDLTAIQNSLQLKSWEIYASISRIKMYSQRQTI